MGGASIMRAITIHKISPEKIIIESTFNSLLSTVKNRFKAMGIPSFPSAHVLVFLAGVSNGFNAFNHNPSEYARSVDIPTLVLHGGRDARVTLGEAKSVYKNLSGEKIFISYPGVGHQIFLKAVPQAWKKDMLQFLGLKK